MIYGVPRHGMTFIGVSKENFNGSRILITTRLKKVADYASSGNNLHYMRFLNFDESWNLFYKKVFEEKNVPLEFETVGRGIVEKCQGLPLTIIVVAGLFTSFNQPSLNQWRNIAENLNSLLNTDPEEKCSKVLSLSYNHLPPHLKVCFLYFGVFPEDSEICVKILIRLWVAEGFLKLELNNTTEEVGVAYLQDLVDRGLVQIIKRSFDGEMKCCRVHDVLHNFCLREAQREKLLCVINENSVEMGRLEKQHALNRILMRINRSMSLSTCSDPKACRWISSQLNRLDLPIIGENLEFRSILYFGWETISSKPFPSFEVLRVLDISSRLIREHHIPSEIVNLVNLRCLKIEMSGLKDWRNAHFTILECLILSCCWDLEEFPASFADITCLRLIMLTSCRPSLLNSAKQIQEERLGYGDDKFIVKDDFCTLFQSEEEEEEEEKEEEEVST